MLECVVNVSEGRRAEVVAALARAGGQAVLDVHSDPHHHRSVLTLAGPGVEEAALAVAAAAVAAIDMRHHAGAHPRLGAADVVPFAPLTGDLGPALAARGRVVEALAGRFGVPCFYYGPERSLPEVRRRAFVDLGPDAGPPSPHPTAGATCAGARPLLVAYNLWLAPPATVAVARAVATALRRPEVRALGLDVGGRAQVSCNLVAPGVVGPEAVHDFVAGRAEVAGAELVGLAPLAVVHAVPRHRWDELGLSEEATIEARLGEAGLEGGSSGAG